MKTQDQAARGRADRRMELIEKIYSKTCAVKLADLKTLTKTRRSALPGSRRADAA